MHYTAENMLIRSDDDGDTGVFAHVTPQRAEWQYLHMTADQIQGQSLRHLGKDLHQLLGQSDTSLWAVNGGDACPQRLECLHKWGHPSLKFLLGRRQTIGHLILHTCGRSCQRRQQDRLHLAALLCIRRQPAAQGEQIL